MDYLPVETIINIFQCLPQRNIVILSDVCQRWQNIIVQPLFFNTLNIYSIHDLNKYIKIGQEVARNEKVPIGHLVKHLYFHTEYPIFTKVMLAMIDTFPNLHSIQGTINIKNTSPLLTNRFKQLEYINDWYQKYNPNWVSFLHHHSQKIKSLEFTIIPKLLSPSNIVQTNQIQVSASSIARYYSTRFYENYKSYNLTSSSYNYNKPLVIATKIYTINLPALPSLTNLSINCKSMEADEHLFESIHQSCPQLTTLTLKSLEMHISNDYIENVTNSFIQPNTALKELSIGNKIHDSQCYDYLSFKYPHLESLHFTLQSVSYTQISIPFFKLAIYNMITRYKWLKKLVTKLECEQLQNNIWPHSELFYWLQLNPTQLTHLDYNYAFIYNIFTQQQVDFENNLSQFTPVLSSNFQNHTILFQPHNYLNHLSSLSLGNNSFNVLSILHYFYLCNRDKNVLSNSIEDLKMETSEFGSIHYWLTAFPNLKSLSIIGDKTKWKINNEQDKGDEDDEDDEDDDNNDYLDYPDYDDLEGYYDHDDLAIYTKKIYAFFKNKMALKQQQMDTDSTSMINKNHCYKLKSIEIANCQISFKKDGWNGFFKHFHNLKTIILCNINLLCPITEIDINRPVIYPVQKATFDLSHLSLDLLKIKRFNYDRYTVKIGYRDHYVKELFIHQTLCNTAYYVGYGNEHKNKPFGYKHSTTLNVICKSIDNIIFDEMPSSTPWC